MSVRIVFLGAKPIGYRCLEYLIVQQQQLDIELLGLGTQLRPQFDATFDLALFAKEHGIPLLPSLDALPECDIIYSVQHHEILLPKHISRAKQIAVNLHLAPLPEYRGCNQFSFAILDQARTFGVSLHEIAPGIDSGAVLFEDRFPIAPDCWVEDLYLQTVEVAYNLFTQTLAQLLAGDYQKTSQSDLGKTRRTSIHYRSEIEAIKHIDLNQDAAQIARQIRATSMPGFEPPYCIIAGKKVYFDGTSS